MLRFKEAEAETEGWIPILFDRGFDGRFLRDEIMIGAEECLCGRVCRGCPEARFPFFTPSGSFVWGRVGTIARDFPVSELGNVRGRCITEGFESLAIFPLVGEQGPVGCLHLADRTPDKFSDTWAVLEAVCRRSGPSLLRFSEREREAALIRAVEAALMPRELPRLPGLDLAVSFASATESAHIGGDFYDVIERADGEVVLFVGDYAGKGIGAAGMAARARHLIAGLVREAESLSALLSEAEKRLEEVLPYGKFVTLAACRLSHNGALRAALAGHPSPIVLDPTGEARELILPPNAPLGFFHAKEFKTGETILSPAETLLLYTDGISESRRGGRLFGYEGVAACCRNMSGCGLAELADGVCRGSAEFHDERLPGDDRLALAARLVGSSR